MGPPIATTLDATLERLQSWVGRAVVIDASLSRMPISHNRHFATKTKFAMRLEFVGVRFSGAALMFEGRQGDEWVLHEVSLEAALVLEFITPDTLTVVERFGPSLERQSIITARAIAAEPLSSPANSKENKNPGSACKPGALASGASLGKPLGTS